MPNVIRRASKATRKLPEQYEHKQASSECHSRAAKAPWPRSGVNPLKAARDLSHQNQDEQNDQNQAQHTAWSVTPVSQVWPGRQSAHEEQNNHDQ
jgi:hypothetical protein